MEELVCTHRKLELMLVRVANLAIKFTNKRKIQKEMADVSNVTEVIIRHRYKEILKKLLFEADL
jgi:transcription initiation factor TFIIIB Brf1 subunit/transcription initiation factor TFIIB